MAKNRARRVRSKKNVQQRDRLLYGVGIVLVLLVAAGVAYSLLTTPPDVAEARLEFEATIGEADAPVEIIEYGAYGCHACRQVHQVGILDQVLAEYGDQVEFRFRNFPRIHVNDPLAAEAAQCVLDQDEAAFWAFHTALYDLSDSTYNTYTAAENYATLADHMGLDGAALAACLDKNTHQRTVEKWDEQGDQQGVRATPTFYVNGRQVGAGQLLQAVEIALQ